MVKMVDSVANHVGAGRRQTAGGDTAVTAVMTGAGDGRQVVERRHMRESMGLRRPEV